MSDALRQELSRAFDRLKWPHYQKLIGHYGLPKEFILQLPEHEIGIDGNKLVMATGYLEDGTIEDLIYFSPAQPDEWRLEKGYANWLGRWDRDTDDLRIWKNPMQLLRAGGVGVVPLNKSARHQLDMLRQDLGAAA